MHSGCNHLDLGIVVLDLPLPSESGRGAEGADLNPKSLSWEGAVGAACPGGAASVGATGTPLHHPLLDCSCSYPSVLKTSPQIPSAGWGFF